MAEFVEEAVLADVGFGQDSDPLQPEAGQRQAFEGGLQDAENGEEVVTGVLQYLAVVLGNWRCHARGRHTAKSCL